MITSTRNRRVAGAIRLKRRAARERERRFLVEGVGPVTAALETGAPVQDLFVFGQSLRLRPVLDSAERVHATVQPVSQELMRHLAGTVTPQGVVAVVGFVDVPVECVEAAGVVPVLHEVRDPGNAGTIVRSADAAGAAGVVLTRASVDVYNEKAVRAAAGSLFHVPVVRDVDLGETVAALRDRGFSVLAADADGEASIHDCDLSGPTAVVFGNEARGVPEDAARLADRTVRVPMQGRAESLNLAAAAAVVMFESARQRFGTNGTPGGSSLADLVEEAAHDIRSPVTGVKAFASMLSGRWERLDDGQRLEMVEGIEADAGRAAAIVSRLVDAARLSAGTLVLAPVRMDVAAVAREAAAQVSRAGHPDVVVEGSEPGAAVAWADIDRVRTMLLAAIEAARWSGSDGPVHVRIRAGDGEARLEVRVWRAGSVSADASPHGGGGRLAMFVALGLARAHGGEIEQPPGEPGFVIVLPRGLPSWPSE